ncbi:MAG: hypothetical protein WDA17_02080 [Sphaerochaetaceae bacterium]
MIPIYNDLYQFNSYVKPIDLTFNQYLLLSDEPTLIHTGDINQVLNVIDNLKEILKEKSLSYIFVSHFEADECGGLSLLLKEYPEAIVVCNDVCTRQIRGFGIEANILTKRDGESLITNASEFEFIAYPSEIHLWDGLFAYEKRRKIFFSSDTMISFGQYNNYVERNSWENLVEGITINQIPDPTKLESVKISLRKFDVDFVGSGHGMTYLTKEN